MFAILLLAFAADVPLPALPPLPEPVSFEVGQPTLAPQAAPFCKCDLVGGCKCADCDCNVAKPKPVSVLKQNTGAVAHQPVRTEPAVKAIAPAKPRAGSHSHWCNYCRAEFWHFPGQDHICPTCKRAVSLMQYRQAPRAAGSSGCASGNCGTRRGFGIFRR